MLSLYSYILSHYNINLEKPQQKATSTNKTPEGWRAGEGLGPESVFLLRSQDRISLGANNLCVGLIHTKFLF